MKSFALVTLSMLMSAPLRAEAAAPVAPTSQPATTRTATSRAASATMTVSRGNLPLKFDNAAYFEPLDPLEVRLRFKQYAGELTIVASATSGSPVKKGDLLLQIDSVTLNKQLDAASNELLGARAALEKIEADFKLSEASEALKLKTQQDAVHDAEDALKYWETVDGPQMLRGWDLQLQQYQHQVDDRSDELEQLRKMYKSEELTSATADIVVKRALRGLDLAKIGLTMEMERIEKSKATVYPASKRNVDDGLTRARQTLAALETSMKQARVQWQTTLFTSRTVVATGQQKVDELRGDLEKLTVTAPVDGVCWYGQLVNGIWIGGDAKTLRPGEKVGPGQVLLTFHAPGKLRAVADLAEAKYFSVPSGTKVTVLPSAFPGLRLDATAEAPPRTGIATPDRGIVYPARLTTGDVDPTLLPGMRATARFDLPPAENVLLVPAATVGGTDVWVVGKDGSETKRAVVTGRTDGKQVEVLSGLVEGDVILAQPKVTN